MEKRQIVERLLKVNANVTSRRGRGRGRGLRNNGVTSYEEISFQTPSKSEVDLKVEEELSEKESDHNTPTSLQSSEDAFMKSELKHGSEESTPLPDNKLQCVSSPNVKLNIHSCNVGYIRFISSSRLSPQTVICLPPAENDNEKCAYAHTTTKHLGMTRDIPKLRLCDMGCGCVRRYECPKTGRSLCSLSCYKANLCQFLEPSLTVST
ncbi:unnamed protein product [Heterobilharzia americana]|nr:unnamed protein product [Heterobilharzia americana]